MTWDSPEGRTHHMTDDCGHDLDEALAQTTPESVTAVSVVTGRHVHVWSVCPCGAHRDLAAPRRGRSARRFGIEQERRIERVYGPRKVGEYGDPIDLIGRDFAWQSKATHDPMPEWLTMVDSPVEHAPPSVVVVSAAAMRPFLAGRLPLVIQTWVRRDGPAALRTRDRIWVRAGDWGAMHGHRKPIPDEAWIVMQGAHFLDVHGRDEP